MKLISRKRLNMALILLPMNLLIPAAAMGSLAASPSSYDNQYHPTSQLSLQTIRSPLKVMRDLLNKNKGQTQKISVDNHSKEQFKLYIREAERLTRSAQTTTDNNKPDMMKAAIIYANAAEQIRQNNHGLFGQTDNLKQWEINREINEVQEQGHVRGWHWETLSQADSSTPALSNSVEIPHVKDIHESKVYKQVSKEFKEYTHKIIAYHNNLTPDRQNNPMKEDNAQIEYYLRRAGYILHNGPDGLYKHPILRHLGYTKEEVENMELFKEVMKHYPPPPPPEQLDSEEYEGVKQQLEELYKDAREAYGKGDVKSGKGFENFISHLLHVNAHLFLPEQLEEIAKMQSAYKEKVINMNVRTKNQPTDASTKTTDFRNQTTQTFVKFEAQRKKDYEKDPVQKFLEASQESGRKFGSSAFRVPKTSTHTSSVLKIKTSTPQLRASPNSSKPKDRKKNSSAQTRSLLTQPANELDL